LADDKEFIDAIKHLEINLEGYLFLC